MFTIDWQIHLSDLLIAFAGLIAFFKVFLTTRDILRELVTDVKSLRIDVERIDGIQADHHEWLVRNGLDRRSWTERRDAGGSADSP